MRERATEAHELFPGFPATASVPREGGQVWLLPILGFPLPHFSSSYESFQLLGSETLYGILFFVQGASRALLGHIVEGLNGTLASSFSCSSSDCLLKDLMASMWALASIRAFMIPRQLFCFAMCTCVVVSKVPAVWVSPTVECTWTTWREGNLPT